MNKRGWWLVLFVGALTLPLSRAAAEDPKGEKKDSPAAPKKDAPPSGEKKKDDKGGAAGKDANADGAFDSMMDGKPGPEHKILVGMAGTWDHSVKWAAGPWGEAGESKGTTIREMILGGRFVRQETKGPPMKEGEPPFEGRGVTGYDRMRKQYVNAWIDNEGTGIMMSYGTADATGKVITYTSEEPDWENPGKLKKGKQVYRIKDAKTHVFEMYETGPDDKEFVMLEVTYTKK